MSHFSTIRSQITCLVTLKKALADLGYEFSEGHGSVRVRGHESQETVAQLSIHVSKKYDVGVVVTNKGLEFIADWWGVETTRGVTQEQFIQRVTQRYAYHKVKTECERMGFTLDLEEETEDQALYVRLTKWA